MARLTVMLLGGDEAIYNEDSKAAEAITPGHLISLNSSGDTIKHATAGGRANRFALERSEMGKGIDDAYAVGDTVKAAAVQKGHRVNALIASGQNITVGGILESAGNGTLRALAAGQPIAMALETINNSAGPGNARLRVEIL
jgi:hypothetical protein